MDDGTYNLVELGNNHELILNKDRAVEQFFLSLYSNFEVIGNSRAENKIMEHIAIILITDNDGFFIQYTGIHNSSEGNILVKNGAKRYHIRIVKIA